MRLAAHADFALSSTSGDDKHLGGKGQTAKYRPVRAAGVIGTLQAGVPVEHVLTSLDVRISILASISTIFALILFLYVCMRKWMLLLIISSSIHFHILTFLHGLMSPNL